MSSNSKDTSASCASTTRVGKSPPLRKSSPAILLFSCSYSIQAGEFDPSHSIYYLSLLLPLLNLSRW